MFRCNICDNFKDSDYDVCEVDPDDNTELICEACSISLDEDGVNENIINEIANNERRL
jgi:hypothetical protein